ncbi:uncharacterized protein LOC143001837 [Genypterus blacodes]|uniref:uncharacterized protein LOC143001837 n=1 Tax=Genypterus blacodes TaxID=154954 RepID=UPI003F7649EB
MCNKMSDVRLSNASPTLERVDARQPDNARPPVRRNLFGAPDREETRRYFRDAQEEERRVFAETYDFDPGSDRPLSPHNYSWELVSGAPEFYSRPAHRRQRPHGNVDLRRGQQDAEDRNERCSVPEPDRNGSRKRPAGAPGACASESQSKRSRTNGSDDDDEDDEDDHDDDEDDDDDHDDHDDEEDGSAATGSPSVPAAEEKPSELDNRTERQ